MSTLCVTTVCVTPPQHHHKNTDLSSWAGCGRTPKGTRITTQTRIQFLGRMLRNTKNTKITTKTRLQFLGRMLQHQKRQKITNFIVKIPFKSIAEHRKVRELPRKMNIEEVDELQKYENLQTKPAFDPVITTKNEHRRS